MPLCHFIGKNVWILKPTSLNRGQGIHVASSFKKIKKLIRDYCRGREMMKESDQGKQNTSMGKLNISDRAELLNQLLTMNDQQQQQKPQVLKHSTFIIQKYIERPLLINKRKFDIRVWVMLTSEMEVFFFKEGYLRTSSSEYSTDKSHLGNDYIHLTNNAVQKNAPNYGNFEDGNQLSFPYLRKYLQDNFQSDNDHHDFEKAMLPKMMYYAALTMISAKKKINPNKKKHCFEIFGYDYIIDSDFNVWLIEVNTNPCIEESSSILKMLIPRMLDDAFKLTIDKLFPAPHPSTAEPSTPIQQSESALNPDYNFLKEQRKGLRREIGERIQSQSETFKVDGYEDDSNMWEKIAQLKGSNEQPQILVPKPERLINSDRLINFIDQHEMRLVKPDIIEGEKSLSKHFSKV